MTSRPGVQRVPPPFRQIADHYALKIRTGTLKPGDWLPTGAEIMQTWQVSKATAGKATDLLKSRGLVETVPAKGLRVISPEHEHPAAPEPAPAAAKRTRAVRLPPDKRTRLKASDPAESAQVEPRPGLGPKRIGEQSD